MISQTPSKEMLSISAGVCDTAMERATYALKIAEEDQAPLKIALDHLTLARAMLYKAHLGFSTLASAGGHVTAAVDGLRVATAMHHFPRGLLTRAWLRCLSGDEAGCRADLAEAWEIAERGPMPLFQADIQLTRARLFRDRNALAEARQLIEKHRYHRRDGELADAEEAAREWKEEGPIQRSEPLQAQPELKLNACPTRDHVVISYSHEDEKLMKELLKHLKPFTRSGSVRHWSDQQITAGSKWFEEIRGALQQASVAVLLVSPSFLASNFIHEHELGPLLKEGEVGGVKILWLPLRASAYEETPLRDYQAVSSPDKPLAQMSKADRDEAWVRICKEIKKTVKP
jgi:TIR domain